MIEPLKSHDALLRDISCLRFTSTLNLWWLGQSGFLVQYRQKHLLLDPYLSDSLTKKYAGTDKPHVRMTARVAAPEKFDFIDVASSSHNHTDHLDAETLAPLFRENEDLKLVLPAANTEFARERIAAELAVSSGGEAANGTTKVVTTNGKLMGIDAGQSLSLCGFTFHAVPAAHESIERDEQGRCKFLGYVIEAGPWTIYHSGDTVLYEGMAEGLRKFKIDVALLPINGALPERRVAGNLDGPQAAELAKAIGARVVIPCHYEMFEFNSASPAEFVAAAEKIGQPCAVLRCGERWSSSELTAVSGF